MIVYRLFKVFSPVVTTTKREKIVFIHEYKDEDSANDGLKRQTDKLGKNNFVWYEVHKLDTETKKYVED